jgi:mannonate dehydratase
LPGRDEEIENYIAAIQALAKLDVRLLCYNWMAGIGWYRTKVNVSRARRSVIERIQQR